ncbi:hypothetical protein GCM10009716_42520 [Streptomyces sodiiphilus]|uniref:OmpR/PhoB-type domain-containing protein n=1 Tax=Streptomyces sodiiphilus TaxID=226217 RepID=A0ABN2PT58_9ACTN
MGVPGSLSSETNFDRGIALEIKLLGSVVLAGEGRESAVVSQRSSAVLAMLTHTPGVPVPSDQLVDELWGGRVMANARNALQVNVRRLRKQLEAASGRPGNQILRTVNSGYLLDVPPDRIDAHRFLALADSGARSVGSEPEAAIQALESALALWRGPALVDVCEGMRCRIQAAHLEERRITAYEDLTAARLAANAASIPVSVLRQLAAENPGRERLVELLMLALYREGRQTEALDAFHQARHWLASDLGLEPGRALHCAYQAILRQDRDLGEPRRALVHSAVPAPDPLRGFTHRMSVQAM